MRQRKGNRHHPFTEVTISNGNPIRCVYPLTRASRSWVIVRTNPFNPIHARTSTVITSERNRLQQRSIRPSNRNVNLNIANGINRPLLSRTVTGRNRQPKRTQCISIVVRNRNRPQLYLTVHIRMLFGNCSRTRIVRRKQVRVSNRVTRTFRDLTNRVTSANSRFPSLQLFYLIRSRPRVNRRQCRKLTHLVIRFPQGTTPFIFANEGRLISRPSANLLLFPRNNRRFQILPIFCDRTITRSVRNFHRTPSFVFHLSKRTSAVVPTTSLTSDLNRNLSEPRGDPNVTHDRCKDHRASNRSSRRNLSRTLPRRLRRQPFQRTSTRVTSRTTVGKVSSFPCVSFHAIRNRDLVNSIILRITPFQRTL